MGCVERTLLDSLRTMIREDRTEMRKSEKKT